MASLRVLLAFNPRSGRGKGARAAAEIAGALQGRVIGARTCAVRTLELGPGAEVAGALGAADVLAVAGGDGSVHHLAPAAAEAGVPLYHVPCGNENLLAREFGMDERPATLLAALEGWRVREVDRAELVIGEQRGHFLLMCGFGPDASVIRRLHEARQRAVGHAAYLWPVLRELLSPCFERVSVRVDGERIVADEPGVLLVANSRQYALRMDPAVRASMSDGLLDVVFLPCASRARALLWGARSRLRRHERHPDVRYVQGREIEVESRRVPFQLDGECPGVASGVLAGVMRITTRPGALRVLALR